MQTFQITGEVLRTTTKHKKDVDLQCDMSIKVKPDCNISHKPCLVHVSGWNVDPLLLQRPSLVILQHHIQPCFFSFKTALLLIMGSIV